MKDPLKGFQFYDRNLNYLSRLEPGLQKFSCIRKKKDRKFGKKSCF